MKKPHGSNGSLPLQFAAVKGTPAGGFMLHRQTANAGLRALPPMTAQIATALGPALDEPGAPQQPCSVHVGEGSLVRFRCICRLSIHPPIASKIADITGHQV
jgi:hypothetical protein